MSYYYATDHLGSVREMTNSSGSIVARYSYDPYGRTTLVSGSNLATKQYAGYYMHQTSGLYLTKHRAFDTNTGRWLSRDPIAEGGGINLYEYCRDEPIIFEDPFGTDGRSMVLAGRGVIIAGDGNPVSDFVGEGMVVGGEIAQGIELAQALSQVAAQQTAAQQAAAAAIERQKAHDTYKARCNQSPPPGLDPCAEARWKLQRERDCKKGMEDFDTKYTPGRHANDIANRARAIQKLEDFIKNNCPSSCP